jgi:hypothetical protein
MSHLAVAGPMLDTCTIYRPVFLSVIWCVCCGLRLAGLRAVYAGVFLGVAVLCWRLSYSLYWELSRGLCCELSQADCTGSFLAVPGRSTGHC